MRLRKDPPSEVVQKAFEELGTHNAVAAAFGVTRHVVTRWISLYGINVVSKPEVRHANFVKKCLEKEIDRIRVAQWVTDEGSVGVTFMSRMDYTAMLVCGGMNDNDAILAISSILQTPFNCSRSGKSGTLPMLGVRMVSAKAYALLTILLPYMSGLRALEGKAALAFFPPSGTLRGRHTTDEFLIPVWREFADASLKSWNAKRRQSLPDNELKAMARDWVNGRIRRARRFIDAT